MWIKTFSLTSSNKGFTLVELLVVIGLIGLIGLVALPSVTSYTKVSMNTSIREIAATVKEAYNSTAITGKVHRLVYDLKNGQYWVEVGPENVLLETEQSRAEDERRKRFTHTDQTTPDASTFTLDRTVTRGKKSLPRGVEFEDVFTQQSKDPVKEGLTYTHFFPHGVAEQTVIHLKDHAQHQASLLISPVIGRTTYVERYVRNEAELAN